VSDWRAAAACRGKSVQIFFPDRIDHQGHAEARAICAGCPSRVPCLEEALTNREQYGIFGGLTATARVHLRRRMTRCEGCDRLYPWTTTNRSYCGDECRTAARRRSWAEYKDRTG